jgi:hypothetical protein
VGEEGAKMTKSGRVRGESMIEAARHAASPLAVPLRPSRSIPYTEELCPA